MAARLANVGVVTDLRNAYLLTKGQDKKRMLIVLWNFLDILDNKCWI